MSPLKVIVNGALGKMGQQVLSAVSEDPEMNPVGGIDLAAKTSYLSLADTSSKIPLSSSLDEISDDVDVVVDFTNSDGAELVLKTLAPKNIDIVIGSTGIKESTITNAASLADKHNVGILIAPNFAIGAVVMNHLSRIAAPFFDYADLTEMHHENKIDAPSGTALSIAEATSQGKNGDFKSPDPEKELVPGTRGGTLGGITIHSARMPGRVAHHELVFGALGQTLTIRHDSINRESFMPGVLMAIKYVKRNSGLTVGLDKVMGL